MGRVTIVNAINSALDEEMARDRSVVVLGEDVGKDGGVFRVTEGLLEKYGPERVIDTPLAELAIVGTSVGMAVCGLRPVAEIQFMGFVYEAIEQIYSHAGRIRARSRGRFTCPLVIRTPYGIGIKGPELHSESSESILCHMPGIKVVVPSSPHTARGLMKSAIRDPDPVIFLEPSRLYRSVKADVGQGDVTVPIGRAGVFQEGDALTVVTWGTMLYAVADAAGELDVEIIDLLTLKPFDEETVLESIRKTGRLVIVHEATKYCGLGAEIAAFAAEEAMMHLRAPVLRVAAPEGVVPMARLEDDYMPKVDRIRRALEKALEY
ncbi:MAG: alpha-ketoacid dehydrogenase subunit beta [Thermodesulfobacteriota bacterium]